MNEYTLGMIKTAKGDWGKTKVLDTKPDVRDVYGLVSKGAELAGNCLDAYSAGSLKDAIEIAKELEKIEVKVFEIKRRWEVIRVYLQTELIMLDGSTL